MHRARRRMKRYLGKTNSCNRLERPGVMQKHHYIENAVKTNGVVQS